MLSLVKQIWFSPYQLQYARGGRNARVGAVLRVDFADHKTGHADLHPYPEKGEPNLNTQIEKLKKKNPLPLGLRALILSRVEACALAGKVNLLSSLNIPLSHFLIWDVEHISTSDLEKAYTLGFRVFKVKLRKPLREQTQTLLRLVRLTASFAEEVKWRVDFHFNMTNSQWHEWETGCLPKMPLQNLDFVEAPFAYRERLWRAREQQCPLALDIWSGENRLPVNTLVCKSSRTSLKDLFIKTGRGLFKRVVFTHTLTHSVDQLSSAWCSAYFYRAHPRMREVCGLVQTSIYKEHDFTLPYQGPVFPRSSCPGWGLEPRLLNRLCWKKLF